jgi:hypothetical protein
MALKRSSRLSLLFIVGFCGLLALIARYHDVFLAVFWILVLAVLGALAGSKLAQAWRRPSSRPPTPPLLDHNQPSRDQILLTAQIPTRRCMIQVGRCGACDEGMQAEVGWLAKDNEGQELVICDRCRDSLILMRRTITRTQV